MSFCKMDVFGVDIGKLISDNFVEIIFRAIEK